MDAAALLVELRMLGATVRLDSGDVRVRAPRRVLTPELAARIREHKPQLAALLTATEDEIAWRVAQIGAELLANVPDAEAGICPTCWRLILGRTGRCVLCCLAAAAVIEAAKATPTSSDISAPDRAVHPGSDMSLPKGVAA